MEAVIGTIGVATMGSIVGSITTVSSSISGLITNIKLNKQLIIKIFIIIITDS